MIVITVRIEEADFNEIKKAAEASERSASYFIRLILRRWVSNYTRKDK